MLELATEKAKGQQEKQQANKLKGDSKDPIAEMEAMLTAETDANKRDFYNAKIREMKAQAELRAREAEARLREPPATGKPGGKNGETAEEEDEDEAEAKKKVKAKKEMATIAMDLLARGVDPTVVSQYLAGGTAMPMITGTGAAQGFTVKDMMSLMTFFQAQNKGNDATMMLIQEIRNEIKEMRNNPPGNNGVVKREPTFHYVVANGKVQKN